MEKAVRIITSFRPILHPDQDSGFELAVEPFPTEE
jgi:hypothetical protein